MVNVFVQALSHNFDIAFRDMESALVDCPEHLWEKDLWPDEAPTGPHEDGGLRGSAPWILAHHALVCLDYDLTGDFEQWDPPPPIGEFLIYADPTRVFTKAELLDYVAWCRERVRKTLDSLTDDVAARRLPDTHRYSGTPYAIVVSDAPLHVVEHASQIRQFVRSAQIS